MLTKFTAKRAPDGVLYLKTIDSKYILIFMEGAGCNIEEITDEMANLVMLYRKQITPKQHAPTFMKELGCALKAFIQFEPR